MGHNGGNFESFPFSIERKGLNLVKLDLDNTNHQLIIGALVNLVEDEGYSPREAFELLEDIKRNTYHALMEISQERKK